MAKATKTTDIKAPNIGRDISLYSTPQTTRPSIGATKVGGSTSGKTFTHAIGTGLSYYNENGVAAGGGVKPNINPTTEIRNPNFGNPNTESGNPQPQGNDGRNEGSYYADPVLPQQDPNAVYLDEIQKAASEKNYKTLLQSDIAAYNLKMKSQKYLDNMLADQGLGTQGYGTSAHVGVENNAANLYAQNLENYNEREATALSEAQERQRQEEEQAVAEAKANATESDNQLVTFLSYSDGSDESINGYMEKYGYTLKDGVWVNKETGEPASAYIQAAVQSAMENSSSSTTPDYSAPSNDDTVAGARNALQNWQTTYNGIDTNGYDSIESLRKAVVGNKDNSSTDTLNAIVGNELSWIESRVKTGTVENGTLFKVQRGDHWGSYHEAYLILYLDGKYYIVSDDDREEEQYQVSSRYNKYQGPKEEVVGK